MDKSTVSFTPTRQVAIHVRELSIKTVSKVKNSNRKWFSKPSKHPDLELASSTSKVILHPMSFDIAPCSLTCIIGGSGSGKTTLLNALANRHFKKSSMVKSGSLLYNNETSLDNYRHAYVIQQDILMPTLTCFETLMFSAELKLPKLTMKDQRIQLVHELILQLGLKECKDTIVGDSQNKGLSGGERRRLSVGLQLISNPSVIFLDEPTTGLDSYNALQLCQSLQNLAKSMNKTIIMSIHQPRADIFKLFDTCLILSKGRLCYGDSYSRIFDHFSRLGFVVPKVKVNPADFYVDITSIDTRNRDSEIETSARVSTISNAWETEMLSLPIINEKTVAILIEDPVDDHIIFTEVGSAPFLREVSILIRRNLRLQIRDPINWGGNLFEALFLGLICGWIFFKPGLSSNGIRSMEGALYSSCSLQSYLFLLSETYRLCQQDLKVFDRERMEGCISVTGWLVARRISKFMTEDFFIPLLFSVTTYFMYGLRLDSAKYFFKYFAGVLISHLNTVAFATLAASVSRDVSIATLVANLNFTFQSMTQGLFANARTLPVYVRWCKYVAYLWYAFGFLISNQFSNFVSDCDPTKVESCYQFSGSFILENLGFPENWNALPICVVLAFAIGHYIVAGIILTYMPVDISMAKEVKSNLKDIDNSVEIENLLKNTNNSNSSSIETENPISLILRDINLSVTNKLKKSTKKILNNINAKFIAGELNIIMGSSGSGKTTLLNYISGRLSSTLTVNYLAEGFVYLDNYEIKDTHILRPVCSYVIQEDDHLLSCLTVRETMTFAATLRLSHTKLSKFERQFIVDDIILRMGLRDCANTLVGNELIKGISGGEKRRLSIAIQLITSPKILFLDEPTSGLDSFTAMSIIECLQKLTVSGTTVIMTIHQPRSLEPFASILLLAKGGNVAFNGSENELITHFESMGYKIPHLTNLSDFVIDSISYNTSNPEVEMKTRARVENIINSWNKYFTISGEIIPLETKNDVKMKLKSILKAPAKFITGYRVMLHRQWLGLIRDLNIIIARTTQVTGLAVILSLFFARLKHDNASIQNRLGLIQQMTALYFTGMLNNLSAYPRERDYFYEEFNDDVVDLNSFFFSYLTLEIPFEILSGFLYAIFMIFVIGFQMNAGLFFTIFYASLLIVNAGESLGISFNTIFNHPGFALVFISIFCSVGVCMAGLLAMTLDSFLKAMNYLSPLHYGVLIFANNVFTSSLTFNCSATELSPDGSCLFTNGEQVKNAYHLAVDMTLYYILFSIITVCHRVISWGFLRVKLMKLSLKKLKF